MCAGAVQTLRENGLPLQSVSVSRACLGECVRLILGRMLGQREPHPASPRKPDAAAADAASSSSPAAADPCGDPSATATATVALQQPSAAASDAPTSADSEQSCARFEDEAEFERYFASRDERKFVCIEHLRVAALRNVRVR